MAGFSLSWYRANTRGIVPAQQSPPFPHSTQARAPRPRPRPAQAGHAAPHRRTTAWVQLALQAGPVQRAGPGLDRRSGRDSNATRCRPGHLDRMSGDALALQEPGPLPKTPPPEAAIARRAAPPCRAVWAWRGLTREAVVGEGQVLHPLRLARPRPRRWPESSGPLSRMGGRVGWVPGTTAGGWCRSAGCPPAACATRRPAPVNPAQQSGPGPGRAAAAERAGALLTALGASGAGRSSPGSSRSACCSAGPCGPPPPACARAQHAPNADTRIRTISGARGRRAAARYGSGDGLERSCDGGGALITRRRQKCRR